ncbi:PREDICTED: kinesin-like protein KIF24 isoform X2 [Cyprinodon variegatus]|uniref:kinesin-like protein KIF24 isoform X2 n=1 Tax=Cyprinodon variegatus TaxID=28743 RepID=UPI0007427566|nr:PREDICTED: kinesin-like protein KIF24 isoform X2 [Cyprinodon variegatus]
MTVCLYKCLTAAGLQRYYARFTLMGVYQAAHLSALRMEDYPLLGVCSMEDRARLFQLVQLVKSHDLTSLTYDNVGMYNESDYEGGDEMFPLNNCSLGPDGYGNRDGDGRHNNDKSQNRSDDPVPEKASATPIQLRLCSRSALVCDLGQSKNSTLNERSCSGDHHNGESIKQRITQETSVFNSHIRSVPKSQTCNKPFAQRKRKTSSWKKNCPVYVTKPIPVYEAKRTADYNYGLPLSSHPAAKHVEGRRISVCVRKRPLTNAECRRGEADVVTTPSAECVVVHESKEAVDLREYILQHRFHFDQVFGEGSSNEEVYQKTAYPLVQHMLSGGKATCFAYGQTGAGKTHTMLGSSPGGNGLYALAVQDIFTYLSSTCASLLVYVSFFEIYCGHLYDLLGHRKRLFAREDGKKVVHILGLREVRVDSVSSLLEIISQGSAERTQGTSGVNPLSSRSHALLQIQLRDFNQKIAGRMFFVDLAGSERASDACEPNKLSRMEGAEINQSLLALKECIRSLDKEESHTPFRQSKLTQVLKDSFVGDSMTCMIANISPGHSATEHTLNTLRYADRVKELRGQSGLMGRRRINNNVSQFDKKTPSGSIRDRRNAGTSKNAKSENKVKNFRTKISTRAHPWDAVLCSTPKKNPYAEEALPRDGKDIEFQHISPVRGCLAQNEGPEVRQDGKTEIDVHSNCVSGKHTRAEGMFGQQNGKGGIWDALTVSKRESGFYQTEKEAMKWRQREEQEWIEMRTRAERSRDTCRMDKLLHKAGDNYEKVKHLREYHQQLQQFSPSPSSSLVHPLSSSTSPRFSTSTQGHPSSSMHSSHFSLLTHKYPCLEKTSEVQTETSANSQENIPKGDICERQSKMVTDAAGRATIRKEDERLGGRKGNTKNTETHLLGSNVSDDRRDEELQRLETRGSVWRLKQKGMSDYSRNPLFDSPLLQAIAERPLSPICVDTRKMHVLPQVDTHGDSVSHIMDPLCVSQLHVDQQASLGPCIQRDKSSTCIFSTKNESEIYNSQETRKDCPCYVEKEEKMVNDSYAKFDLPLLELPHSKNFKMDTSSTLNTSTGALHHPQRYVSGKGKNNPSFLEGHDSSEKKEPTVERNTAASMRKPWTTSFIQSIECSDSHFSNSALEYAHETVSKSFSNISEQQLEPLSGNLNLAQSNYCNCSKFVAEPNNSAKLSDGEKSNQQITMERMHHARLCIIEAHMEQLKEMKHLCHKEGELLCQQHDLVFVEFVNKLVEILDRKAHSVNNMRAQLMAYLKSNHDTTQEEDENAVF